MAPCSSPTAPAAASGRCGSGRTGCPAPPAVQFDGSGSTDPDAGDTLTYAWDLDVDGAYDDSTAVAPTRTYVTAGVVEVGLRVTDQDGATGTATVPVTVGAPAGVDPAALIDTPTANLRWHVGQSVSFSGQAVDPQDGPLSASDLSWQLSIQHCSVQGPVTSTWCRTGPGPASGSFIAPDHEYPSHLELTLTARDSTGRTGSATVELLPQTVNLSFTANPTGARLAVGGSAPTTYRATSTMCWLLDPC